MSEPAPERSVVLATGPGPGVAPAASAPAVKGARSGDMTALAVVLGLAGLLLSLVQWSLLGLAQAALLGGAIVLLWKVPLRRPLMWLTALVLLVDEPSARPANGDWTSPWAFLGELLFENLHKLTGVAALRFSLLDLLILAALLLALLRRIPGRPGAERAAAAPAPMMAAAVGAAVTLLILLGWGLARGGDFKNSLWQIRQLLFLPLVTLLFMLSLRGSRDLKVLGAILIGAALLKTGLGIYVAETVFRPRNARPTYVTTHADSMLFALAFVAVAVWWYERRSQRAFLLLLLLGPLFLLGIRVNNRRLAYVEVVAALALAYPLVPWTRAKRLLTRLAILSLPLVVVYLGAGWNSTSKVFRPVQLVRSIAQPEVDRSTATRDIENFNLTRTFRTNPLVGTGFGHGYDEQVRADDISHAFALYRYIPHNSILGIWAFTGLVGFTALWLPMVMGLFMASRAYRRATRPLPRAAALTASAMVVIHLIQAWGDMGIQAWPGVFLMGACIAVAGQLAVELGGYPAPERRPARARAAAPAGGAGQAAPMER